ncbi:MAG: RidA family protein [Alphaproteobacteria bacterium]|jgi:enamine deaminase RidA (YjgF/YER057c/UK114 family)|nr:RidA family protein [Alphaproteobacteria bacterium]MBP9777315.1 RidA family protein [Alphaproteobacteria bacterium]
MIESRLQKLKILLPSPPASAANYAPFVKVGSFVFISGQLPSWNGELKYLGKIDHDLTSEDGQAAARLCALNILAQLKVACEKDLNRVIRCVRLGGFVNATPTFKDHAKVLNGASDLMVDLFGEAGQHARAAVGVSGLPFGVAIEVEALFVVKE